MLLLIWGTGCNSSSRKSYTAGFSYTFPCLLTDIEDRSGRNVWDVKCPPAPKPRVAPPPPCPSAPACMVLAYLGPPRGTPNKRAPAHGAAQGLGMWVPDPQPTSRPHHTTGPPATCCIACALERAGCCEPVADFYFKTQKGDSSHQNHPVPSQAPPPDAAKCPASSVGGVWAPVTGFGSPSSHTLSPETCLQEAPALGLHRPFPGQVLLAPVTCQHVRWVGGYFQRSLVPGRRADRSIGSQLPCS